MSRRAWVPAVLLAVLAVGYGVTASRGAVSLDVWSANLASWSIGTTGTPLTDLDRFPALADNDLRATWVVQRADGRDVVGRAPGTVAAAVPAYALAHLFGASGMSIVPGGLTAALLTAIAITLLFLALRERLGERPALAASLVLGLTTPVWSVAADGVWPHTLTVLGILGMAWAAERERWWLLGLFGGVALWGRLHAAVICAVVGLLLAWWRRRPDLLLKTGAACGAMLGLMMVWTQWMYGRWDPTAAYDVGVFVSIAQDQGLDGLNLAGFLVSPGRGMLVWTPILVLLLPALVRSWRALPDWSRALAVGGVGYTAVQLALNAFKGGEAFFGYRIGLELLACLAPALALSTPRIGTVGRRLLVPVIVAQAAVFGFGALAGPDTAPRISSTWDSNELVARVADQPAYSIALLLACAALAAVVVRMWNDPELRRKDGAS
ncbi:hypothetical protein [Nocardioides nitrophenolicus]|uniref:hypothetical protein n=1 Tax=Nocardioides nitrophenolicus TaxID=60489 RepID=UPI00195E7DDB|nr:hypothetical protein [Nocardioides nitrophenolicus]MBM7515400.1 alpha-1,2-mannosyltransferase [Nocardioides nitrophenolicus]